MEKENTDGLIAVKKVVISVANESNLQPLIEGLLKYCPGVVIFTRDGNFATIEKIFKASKKENTGEVQLQYLTYRDAEAHDIDLVIINLNKFPDLNLPAQAVMDGVESFRFQFLFAMAQRFRHTMVVTSPDRYEWLINKLQDNGGYMEYKDRLNGSLEPFRIIAEYSAQILHYFQRKSMITK